jgi:glycosyltransferase involved in cell wall biosynthesis
MIIGIDASNIRSGGTVAHLSELLRAADPTRHGFSQITVWAEQSMLNRIEDRSWLVKVHVPLLDQNLLHRLYWQSFRASRLAQRSGCHVRFVPSGIVLGDFRPFVTMSHNLLPFEWREIRRYGISWQMLRNLLLRYIQSKSFRAADGLIFLSRYAKDKVMGVIRMSSGKTVIVPHGVHDRFFLMPREQLEISKYSKGNPFRILYVSTVDMYKHQWLVAEAVSQLRASGLPVVLDLVGSAYPPALKRLGDTLKRVDPKGEYVRYLGAISHSELHVRYAEANLCIFASSCENMPNILLEGMASGLPIACSDRGPMPEVLGDAGIYFDPENPQDIARALREMIDSPELRAMKASASFRRVQVYSWQRCANETFGFLAEVARVHHTEKLSSPGQL